MCFVFKYVRYSIKNNLYLILGLLFGVAVTLFTADLYENECRLERTLNFGLQEDDDGYEPRINLAGKPLKALKTPQDFVRPRYYTTELGIRQKLFVGVLTSSHTFESLAIALNETIHVADKIMFFSEAEPHKKHELFSHVVTFSDGRLILKPFHMLKYIADNLLGEYDFFYLVNDSTYVNGPKLLKIVQTLSLSQDVHFGHKMDFESKFCTLDGGIIISNQIMVSVVANLDWCVKNAYSESHDANLGRCIVHAADVPCSDTMTGQRYFGHPLVNPDLPKEKILRDTSLLDGVTVWPIKTAQLFYAVHHHFVKHEVLQVESEIEKLRKAILNTTVILPGNISEPAQWPVGSYPPSKPANRFDLLRWDYFTDKHIYLKTDLDNVVNLEGADLLDVQGVMNASKRHIEEKHDGQLVFEKLVNGYRRFDPARGMDYILDIECKDTVTLQKTTLRLEICKPLGKVELVPVPYVTENARVNIVVFATADNQEHMLKFIESYATVCMEKREKSSLLLVLVYEAEHPGKGTSNDIHSAVKKEAVKQSERFRRDNNKIMWLSVKLPLKAPSWPVLNVLIMDLAVRKFSTENLILLLSPNAELRQDFLNRVRMNTVVNAQVFSPIPFTEYHPLVVYNEELPRPSELDINKNYGHYDTTNANQISFYVKDYKAVRKVIEKWLPLAHGDKDLASVASGPAADISMYAMFARHSATHVMRAVEPALRLRHIEPTCSAADEMCTDRRAFNLGTRGQLGKLLLEYQSLHDAQPPIVKGSLRLYGMKYCPYDQRVKLVLDAKSIPYDSVNINLSSKPGWFLEKGTDGKVPTLELADGSVLAESLIIADYLDEVYPEPALYPKDPRAKAQDRLLITKYGSVLSGFYKFLSAAENGYTPANFNQFVCSLMPFEAELVKRGTKFFAGSKPGMLDLILVPWLERAPVLAAIGGPEYELPVNKLPKLLKWRSDILEIPEVQKSVLHVDTHKRFFLSRTGPNFYDFDYDCGN